MAGHFYAAQVSIPKSLPELEESSSLTGELAEAWQNGTRGSLDASPYLYYHGGGGEPGPSLYLHYDAADNLVQVLDGMKNFWLYDPFQAAQLLYGSNREHGNASPINVESPTVFEDYPYFRFAVPRRCRVRAGQWLYVPLCGCRIENLTYIFTVRVFGGGRRFSAHAVTLQWKTGLASARRYSLFKAT